MPDTPTTPVECGDANGLPRESSNNPKKRSKRGRQLNVGVDLREELVRLETLAASAKARLGGLLQSARASSGRRSFHSAKPARWDA